MNTRKPTYEELEQRLKELVLRANDEDLTHSDTFKRVLFDDSHVALAVMDVEQGLIIDCNLAAALLYGARSTDEVVGKSPVEFSNPVQYDGQDSGTKIAQNTRNCLANGKQFFEWLHRRPGGELWDSEVQLTHFSFDNKTYLQVSLQDITERKKAEKKLLNYQLYNRLLFYESSIPIGVMDPVTMKLIDCNEAAVKIYGFSSREEVLGMTPMQVSSPTQYDNSDCESQARDHIKMCLEEGSYNFEWKHVRPNGEIWDSEVNTKAFEHQGRKYIQIVHKDITKQKIAEAERNKNLKEIERFNKLAKGRELMIVDLKQQVNELSLKLGVKQPYLTYTEPHEKDEKQNARTDLSHDIPALDSLVDHDEIQKMLDDYCSLLGISSSILDTRGNPWVTSNWQRACSDFLRINPESCKRCMESDTELANKCNIEDKYSLYECKNGMIDAAAPIYIEGTHIANIFVGQLFTEPPDTEKFRQQAAALGFNEYEYLAAVAEIPLVPKQKVVEIITLLSTITLLLIKLGLERFRLVQSEHLLETRNTELKVDQEAALSLAEDAVEARNQLEVSQEAQRESERRYKILVESLADIILVTNIDGRFLYGNPALFQKTGYTAHEFSNPELIKQFYHSEDTGLVMSFITAFISSGAARSEPFEFRLLCKDGSILWLSTLVSRIEYADEIAMQIICRDITEKKKAEELITQKTEELERYFNSALDLLCIADTEGNFRKLNPEWENTLGYPLHELENRKFLDFVHPDDYNATIDKLKDLAMSNKVLNFTNRYKHANGTYRWIEWRSFPVDNLVYAVARDITERKEVEEKLTIYQARQSLFMKYLPVIAFAIDNQGLFTLSEGLGLNNLGLQPGQIVGSSVYDVYKDNDLIIGDIREALAGKPAHNITPIGSNYYEAWYMPALNDQDKTTSVVGIAIDITERLKTEQKLVESEDKFRTLFENITEGVALHEMVYDKDGNDLDYRILGVNPAYKKHTGLGEEEAVGKLGSEVYMTANPPYLAEFGQVASSRIPYHFETYFEPMNRYFMISVVSPKQGQFATVFEDITERRHREEDLKQKNEELARFIYTVSHDLKSPLVTIKSFSSYLVEDIGNNDQQAVQKDLGFIHNAADKMGTLLEELLELSRIGRKDNPKKEFTLASVIQSAVELVAGRISQRNARIIATDKQVILWGDPQRILQLFQNLIDNAVKFMGKQPDPVVEIGVKDDENGVVLFVKDNGSGIDPRYHHKLFGLFEKLDTGTEGTGIGLSLVKRIVEVHNGKVWFESEGTGKGATFYFTLEKTKIITN